MATYRENLATRRDAICTELAALTSTAVGGKADATGDGMTQHQQYKLNLYAELKAIEEVLGITTASAAAAAGPWERVERAL